MRGAGGRSEELTRRSRGNERDPEVGDGRIAIGVEKDVRGLDVTVHDANGMRGGQCARALERDPRRFRNRELSLGDPILKRVTGEEPHDEIQQSPGRVRGVQRHDVWMLCRGNRPSFVQELLLEGGVDGERRIQHFDSHIALEKGIVRAEYCGEPSLSLEGAELELLSERRLELGPQRGDVDAHGWSSAQGRTG